MCLLVVMFGLDEAAPLVVAANRDERLDRPATAMTVLDDGDPRILGGRDEEAGGTWLAVNAAGLVAGLTNRPLKDGRDPSKRSRGELPLLLARHRTAEEAVGGFMAEIDPARYNPAWMLVGDRESLFFVEVGGGERVAVERLGPGIHILENAALDADSVKVDHVRRLVEAVAGSNVADGEKDVLDRLRPVLADHEVPGVGPEGRRPETLAACVHTDDYGTRSSTLVTVPATAGDLPVVRYTEGPPCRFAPRDAGELWSATTVTTGTTGTTATTATTESAAGGPPPT